MGHERHIDSGLWCEKAYRLRYILGDGEKGIVMLNKRRTFDQRNNRKVVKWRRELLLDVCEHQEKRNKHSQGPTNKNKRCDDSVRIGVGDCKHER